MERPRNKLTKKQRVFVAEYQKDFCATDAAIRAGYSEKTAEQIGYQLLQKTSVKEAVDKAIENRLKKAGAYADRVLIELARVGLSDIRRLYDDQGRLKPPGEWDDDTAAAVASVEVSEEFQGKGDQRERRGYTKKVRTYDKNRALDKLATLPNMDPPRKVAHADDSNIMSPLAEIFERIDGKTRGLPSERE